MYYRFGDCTLDTERYELCRAGKSIPLRPKVFQLLVYLLAHCERVVAKDELLEQLWPEQFIGDAALNSCLKAVRQAIGDSGQRQQCIHTLRGRGYRFVAAVEVQEHAPPEEVAPAYAVPHASPPPPSAETLCCVVCQHPQPADATFCDACGTRLLQVCPGCGQAVRLPATFCLACGSPLDEASRPKRVPSPAPPVAPAASHHTSPQTAEQEYKQVTVLGCALANAVACAAQLGIEAMHDLMRAFVTLAQEVVQRYEGTMTQVRGDGFTALFGAPIAQEDHARRAVLAALDLHQRWRATYPVPKAAPSDVLAVCLGLHTGPVVVGYLGHGPQRLYTALGGTTDLTWRLQQLAAPGTVLISEATYRLVQTEVRVEVWGGHDRIETPLPLPAYTVCGLIQRRAGVPGQGVRPLSPFVGRERELAMLHERLVHAVSGEGQIVSITGNPGMGKSRLLDEFRHSLARQQVTYREGGCFPYGNTTHYVPIQALLRQTCGIMATDPPATITTKVRWRLYEAGTTSEPDTSLLCHLLDVPIEPHQLSGLSPQARKARTFALLHQLFLHDSRQQPLVLAIENLHWIDATSEEYLTSLVDQMAGMPLLLLTTYRPAYRPPWLERSLVTQLALPRLAPHESLRVIQSVAKTPRLPDDLIQEMVAKAGGNPFFLEELVWTVREAGTHHPTLTIPDTIQVVLAARIDRLPSAEKRLLQAAAVIGLDVPFSLLRPIAEQPAEALTQSLRHLQTAEFLYVTRAAPAVTYTFKHALTREVAYQSLLRRTRQQYHEKLVQVLEEQSPEIAATQPELLAHHYTEAGLNAPAIAYWQRAGQRAYERSANVEAISYLTQGLKLLPTLPDTPERVQQELTLLITLGVPLRTAKGYSAPEVEKVYTRARELCQQLGETPQLFPVLRGLQAFHFVRAELQTTQELAEQCLILAQRAADPALLSWAHYGLGATFFVRGAFPAARRHLEEGIAHYEAQHHHSTNFAAGHDAGVACLAFAALTLWSLGYPEQALRLSERLIAVAQQVHHPYSLAWGLSFVTRLHQSRRDIRATQEHAAKVMALCTAQGFASYLQVGTILHGWSLTQAGRVPEGLAHMRQILDARQATDSELLSSYWLALLAEAYGKAGQPEAGLSVLAEALLLVDKTSVCFYAAELHRLKGELLLSPAREHAIEAEASFLQAYDLACRQQAKSLELRATMSLSRLWQQQGKRDEARTLLAEVYGWFTEGFDTADLQEAQALLQALGS